MKKKMPKAEFEAKIRKLNKSSSGITIPSDYIKKGKKLETGKKYCFKVFEAENDQ